VLHDDVDVGEAIGFHQDGDWNWAVRFMMVIESPREKLTEGTASTLTLSLCNSERSEESSETRPNSATTSYWILRYAQNDK